MKTLNPTLWRTCRMLAGATRIRLLRRLHDHPGENISMLADALGISQPYASQEMRRIQSRGFLRPVRQGASLVYQPVPDPQVSSAAPLLKAVWQALDAFPSRRDAEINVLAAGLAHERRIALARLLLKAPRTPSQLLDAIPMAACSFHQHVRTLLAGGWIVKDAGLLSFVTPAHPLAKALVRLLRKGAAR